MKKTSPTQRSLAWLRARGIVSAVVEKWNPHARIRQDLFGCIDVLSIDATQTIGVQATSGANVAARITKAKETPGLKLWLGCPHRRYWVMGWRMTGARGTRKLWNARVVELLLVEGEWKEIELDELPKLVKAEAPAPLWEGKP